MTSDVGQPEDPAGRGAALDRIVDRINAASERLAQLAEDIEEVPPMPET